ncbi:golgin subfamily A member 4 isoform X3 [Dermacentor silvarum]|uniref:golgin subfamily A member 4 isoform X3 n=1 Tax=Dermacentor silvarum TaxID=543639 RepID=UPI001897AE60|nr:golgin subfamily A member 4 isoform X3 [Dermacentor silvarum]
MDDPDHKDLLIQQLKDIVRSNEEILKKKEKELEDSAAKYQKLKLQSRAKIAQLTNQAKAQHEASPEVEQGEDASKPTTPHHDASVEASRGRVRVLKHQLDEAKSQLHKKEQEMQTLQRSYESTVERLEQQLLQRDQLLMESAETPGGQTAKQSSGQRQDGGGNSGGSSKEEERLYAHMVYKDSKILELNNQILELERRILDLQENLREKDQVLQARSKAIQLMTEDLSLRSKTVVDDLDDTRTEMRLMQQNFLEQEMSWKQREASLTADLNSNKSRVVDLEESFRKLESARFQLATHNAELQEKVVRLQETVEKAKADQAVAFQAKINSLTKELEQKSAALEETQKTLQETTRETDNRILKARALERRRAKQFERELQELKKGNSDATPSDVTTLQQRIAELEEEKGALQLKALEMEDALSSQAAKLEEMAAKDKVIEELKGQVKAARDEKISLEVQAAQMEEQKEIEEQKMRELRLELEALKEADESSTPMLQQELKAALEEEVKKLLALREEDSATITDLRQKLQHLEEQLASAAAEQTDELDRSLREARREVEEKTRQLEDMAKMQEQQQSEVASKSARIEELEAVLRGVNERLDAQARENEEAREELLAQLSRNAEEVDRWREASERDSMSLQKALEELQAAQCEKSEALKAMQAMQEELEHRDRKVQELNNAQADNVSALKARSEDIERLTVELRNVQEQLQAKQCAIDEICSRESQLRVEQEAVKGSYEEINASIKDLLLYIGASSLGEVKVVWDRSISEKEETVSRCRQELSEAISRSEQLASKVEQLESALKDADSLKAQLAAVNACLESLSITSLEELKSRWGALHENLDLLSQSQKLDKEELNNRIKQLVDEKAKLQEAVDIEKRRVSVLDAEVNELRIVNEKSNAVMEERELALSAALCKVEELQSHLDVERRKTESKVGTLLEQCTDLEKEVSALQLQVEDKERSLFDLTERLASRETELQESVQSFARQEAALQESLQGLQKQLETSEERLSEVMGEVSSLREMLQAKENETSTLRAELTSSASILEQTKSENKSLENKLKKMQKKIEVISSKYKEAESSVKNMQQELEAAISSKEELEKSCLDAKSLLKGVQQELEAALSAKAVLENESRALREQLACVEDEKATVCQQLSETEQKAQLANAELRKLEAEQESLSRKAEDLQQQLLNSESNCQGKEAEIEEFLDKAQKERIDLSCQLQQLNEALMLKNKESEEMSRELSHLQECLNESTQRSSQLDEKCNDITAELAKQTTLHGAEKEQLEQQIRELGKSCDDSKNLMSQVTAELEETRQALAAAQQQLQQLQQLNNNGKELNDRLLKEIASLRTKLQQTEEMLEKECEEKSRLREHVESLKESVTARTDELAQLKVSLSSKDAELDSLRQNAESQTSDLVVKVSELSRDLQQRTGELSLVEAALQERGVVVSNLQTSLEASAQNVQSLETVNKDLVAQVQTLTAKFDESSKEIEVKEQSLQMMKENLKLLEDSLEEKSRVLSELQEANNRLAESNAELARQVEEADSSVASLREKLAGEEHVQATFRSELETAKSEANSLLPQLDDQKKRIDDLEEQLKTSADTQESLLKEVEKLQCEKQATNDTLEGLSGKLRAAESDLQKSDEMLVSLKTEVERLQAQLERMSGQHKMEMESCAKALLEKENQITELQGEREGLNVELNKKKEQLALLSTEIENLVSSHDQQLRELLEAESSARAECSSLTERLADKESEVFHLGECLEELRLENSRAKEQIATFSAEIQNLVQNHDQQMREFADANSKLETEVSTYVAKVGEYDNQIRELEARLNELYQENSSLKERAEQASNEVRETCQSHQEEEKNLELEIERLRGEIGRLNVFEAQYQEAVAELKKMKEQSQSEISKQNLAMQSDQADAPAKVPVVEEMIVPKEAQLLYTADAEGVEADVETLRRELDAARMDIQMAQESALGKEEDIRRLTEDLACMKNKFEEAEQRLRVKHEDAKQVRSASEETKSEAHQDENKEPADAELKKLKLAFKKSRGELRLKVKILEDRTKEVGSLKEQNSCLQKELEQLTEALTNERTALKKFAEELEQRDVQTAQLSSELQSLKDRLDLETEKNESLSRELQTANAEAYNLRMQVEELRLQSREAGSLEAEVEELKKRLESASDALKVLSAENEVLKAGRSQDTECLLSELQSSKTELQRLTAEHEDTVNTSLSRERALQNELDAATELIQQLHSEHADFSRKKSEEFGLLQGQLESLSGDLIKQLEIVDSKVEEADALQSKLQTSQLQLEKFSAEYSILQDVLLQECGERPPGDMTFMGAEFSAFEYLKWLLESVRKRREALESSLAEKDQQISSLHESHKSLQEQVLQTLKGLSMLLATVTQDTTDPNKLEEELKIAEDSRDPQALVRAVYEHVLSLKNTNSALSKEMENLRLSCEEMNTRLQEATIEHEQLQCKYHKMQEVFEKKEQVTDITDVTRIDKFLQTDASDESPKLDKSLQTDVKDELSKEKGQEESLLEKTELLAEIALLKEEVTALKAQQPIQNAGDGDKLNSELAAMRQKSEKMLVKLKLFKEKNDMLVKQLNALRESHAELEHSYQRKSDEVGQLERQCCSLQEDLQKSLMQSEHTESLALSLDQATARAREAEAECSSLRDRVGELLDQNDRLEIESKHLKFELANLKEQADMLTSDNEAFQNLAENLKRARQNLEQELKAQHEQHTKALKDLENRYQKQLEEERNGDTTATASLKRDFAQMQEKYNQILYRHRDLEEEFHVVVEEKTKLEAKCAQLAEDCSAANQALALMEKQGFVGHKTFQELDLLRQEHQQLQERFHQLKSSQLKAEERLVQSASQESLLMKAKLEEADKTIEALRATKEQMTSDEVRRLQQQLDELNQRHAALVEQSQAKEGRWSQERKQLKHIEEHLKQAAQDLSGELEELRTQHEEALRSKLDLRNQMEQAHKDNRALTQQVHNWRSYIRDFENSKNEQGHNVEVERLQTELEQTATQLHQLGLRNEEMSVDLNKVLEEKNGLKQLLAHTQEVLRQREAQLLRLQSPPLSRDGVHVIEMENPQQPADDAAALQHRLREVDHERRELEQRVQELAEHLRTERQRRRLLEGEMEDIEWGKQPPSRQSLDNESHRLLLHDDVIKIPATDYSITRQFMSHASKLRRWFQGRQDSSGRTVHHI